jgi:hypothetical protein
LTRNPKKPDPKITHEKSGFTQPDHVPGRARTEKSGPMVGSGRAQAEEKTNGPNLT